MSDAEDENRHPMDITPQEVMQRASEEVAGGQVRAAICILVFEKEERGVPMMVFFGGTENRYEMMGMIEIAKANIAFSGTEEE